MQIKETVEESVGRQTQRIRRERGYTQQVFSEMVGISTNYLSAVERGKKSIRLEKLVLIMNELQCSADELFMDKIEGAVALTGIVRAQPPFFHGQPMK